MTAPDRIGLITNGLGMWALATRDEADIAVHYLRRDPAVLARDETVLAMVGAAYSRAADEAEEHKHFANGMNCVKTCINLLTPADAAAALAARDKRIRDEALEDAARVAEYHDYGVQSSTAADLRAREVAVNIRALKGGKP